MANCEVVQQEIWGYNRCTLHTFLILPLLKPVEIEIDSEHPKIYDLTMICLLYVSVHCKLYVCTCFFNL